MKRIYRKILRELHPDQFSWRQLTPEQETRQVQRGRDGALTSLGVCQDRQN